MASLNPVVPLTPIIWLPLDSQDGIYDTLPLTGWRKIRRALRLLEYHKTPGLVGAALCGRPVLLFVRFPIYAPELCRARYNSNNLTDVL